MKKLIAALIASVFAFGTVSVFAAAADGTDAPKVEKKAAAKKKPKAKKAAAKADAPKADAAK